MGRHACQLVSGLAMVPSNFALRYFHKYIQFMPYPIMKFYPVLPSKDEIHEQFVTAVCNAVRNNNGNDPDGFFADFETAAINAI